MSGARGAVPITGASTALTAPRPKTRYLGGRDARIQSIIARLPDRLLTRALGL